MNNIFYRSYLFFKNEYRYKSGAKYNMTRRLIGQNLLTSMYNLFILKNINDIIKQK